MEVLRERQCADVRSALHAQRSAVALSSTDTAQIPCCVSHFGRCCFAQGRTGDLNGNQTDVIVSFVRLRHVLEL